MLCIKFGVAWVSCFVLERHPPSNRSAAQISTTKSLALPFCTIEPLNRKTNNRATEISARTLHTSGTCARKTGRVFWRESRTSQKVDENRMKKFALAFCLMVVGLFLSRQNAAAQGTAASIRGTVVDPSGALISNASLTATQTETGLTREVSSDSHGRIHFVELPIGQYRLEAQAKGFQRYVQSGITLDVNQTVAVTIHARRRNG